MTPKQQTIRIVISECKISKRKFNFLMAASLEHYFQYKNEIPVLYDLPVSHKCFFPCFS